MKTIIDFSNYEYDEEFLLDDEKGYFQEYLLTAIKEYENRYKTEVIALGLIGTVGLWTGNHDGGTIFNRCWSPIDKMGEVDNIEVRVNEDYEVEILGHHHDGVHRMKIYLLTENKLNKHAPSFLEYGEVELDELLSLKENTGSLKGKKVLEKYYSLAV